MSDADDPALQAEAEDTVDVPVIPKRIDPEDELQLTEVMVEMLLDNFQPYLWTSKKRGVKHFEEFFFAQYPDIPEHLVRDILIGRAGKGRGLLETIGGTSWKNGSVRLSAGLALSLLLRLLDPMQHAHHKTFWDVMASVDASHILSMNLGKHLHMARGNREGAIKLIRFLNEHRPDVKIDIHQGGGGGKRGSATAPAPTSRMERTRSHSAALKPSLAGPPSLSRSATANPQDMLAQETTRRSSLYATVRPDGTRFNRRLSTRSCMVDLVERNVIKVKGKSKANQKIRSQIKKNRKARKKSKKKKKKASQGDKDEEKKKKKKTKSMKSAAQKMAEIGVRLKRWFTPRKKSQSKKKDKKKKQSMFGKNAPTSMSGEPGKVFGLPLDQVFENTCADNPNAKVPPLLSDCVFTIEANGMNHEGIFRLPGNVRMVQETKGALDQLSFVDLTKIHIDTVASLLKLWLREMPEPLVTFALYQPCIDAHSQLQEDEPAFHARLQEMLTGLPERNRNALAYLLSFLNRLGQNHERHMMTHENLAVVLAPNILRPKEQTFQQIMNDTPHVIAVFKALIEQVSQLFPDISFAQNVQAHVPKPREVEEDEEDEESDNDSAITEGDEDEEDEDDDEDEEDDEDEGDGEDPNMFPIFEQEDSVIDDFDLSDASDDEDSRIRGSSLQDFQRTMREQQQHMHDSSSDDDVAPSSQPNAQAMRRASSVEELVPEKAVLSAELEVLKREMQRRKSMLTDTS